ncbi:hypothetical protein BC829DRAFT_430690 [Chytridium lagenaria]|nr:hypothetical protein BC829DRAFT_430690 [Chytridium lagenaria]
MDSGMQYAGNWTMASVGSGVVGIHAALLPGSKLLLWERFHGLHAPSLYPPNPYTYVSQIGQSEISSEVDLLGNTFIPKHTAYSPFCSGSAQMADGSILIVGGDGDNVGNGYIKDGRDGVRTYTSQTGWVDIGKLQQTRWYPTVTMASILNLDDMSMRELPPLKKDFLEPSRSFPYLSQSVMLPLTPSNGYTATILICGGTEKTKKASKSCSAIIPDSPDPQWFDVDDMPVPRVMGDTVILPTGKVLFVNGAKWGTADGAAGYGMSKDPAFEAISFDPEAPGSKWKVLAKATVPRMYHSTALLLEDGRVVTLGSDQQNFDDPSKDPFEYRIEYYNPDYSLLPASSRPVIRNFPSKLRCKELFSVGFTLPEGSIGGQVKITMVRYGTSTHSSNMDSRLVELELQGEPTVRDGERQITALSPPNGNIAPSGNWLIFLVLGDIPSPGVTVNLQCD